MKRFQKDVKRSLRTLKEFIIKATGISYQDLKDGYPKCVIGSAKMNNL